ncbi:MAG: 30S ribosomal protein S4 [archaeon]
MGDPGVSRKQYNTPSHPWQGDRIKAEGKVVSEYGLKNRKEIWKSESDVRNFRRQARDLIGKTDAYAEERKKELMAKLIRNGILAKSGTLDDILALELRDLLERRLQTIVYKKGIGSSSRDARQLILHGHITVKGRKCTAPSMILTQEEEETLAYIGPSREPPKPVAPKKEKKAESDTASGAKKDEVVKAPKDAKPAEDKIIEAKK